MLEKWKNLSQGKKLLSIILIIIVLFVLMFVAGLVSDTNQTNQLESLVLPDDFKDNAHVTVSEHNIIGDKMKLYSYSSNSKYIGKENVNLYVSCYDESSDSSKSNCEVVEINGEKYLVEISYEKSETLAYCLDNLEKFNELNNATVIEDI